MSENEQGAVNSVKSRTECKLPDLSLKKKRQGQKMEYIIGDGEDTKVIISIGGSQIDLKEEVVITQVSFLSTKELKI